MKLTRDRSAKRSPDRSADRKADRAADPALRRAFPRTLTRLRPLADWRWALVETLAVMTLALGLSWWLRPADPFWLDSGFPWLWLAAAIMALRYGSAHAVLAMAVALAGWYLIGQVTPGWPELPRMAFLGGLVLALIAGEFSDLWTARQHQGQAVTAYLDERLQALTHHHFLLNVSHDRLEEELLARPFTLRETLFALCQTLGARSRTAAGATMDAALPSADWLLQLLAQSCRIETAALFALRDGVLDAAPAATLGEFGAGRDAAAGVLDHADPMLAAALESATLMHVQSAPFIESDKPSGYVVCAPLATGGDQVLGVLVVERIAFTALTLETLQFLTVLLGYYADGLEHIEGTRPVHATYPLCPDVFAVELLRLQRLQDMAFIDSSLVAFALPAAGLDEWIARFERMRRNVDLSWLHHTGRRRVLLVLLPLTNATGVTGYLERVDGTLQRQYDSSLERAGIRLQAARLDQRPLVEQLAALIDAVAPGDAAPRRESRRA